MKRRGSPRPEEIPLAVQGLHDEPHFFKTVICGGMNLDPVKMERDVLHAAGVLQEKTPDLKAIVIECSNLPTYARAVSDQCGIPVFDTMSAANLLAYAVHPPIYL